MSRFISLSSTRRIVAIGRSLRSFVRVRSPGGRGRSRGGGEGLTPAADASCYLTTEFLEPPAADLGRQSEREDRPPAGRAGARHVATEHLAEVRGDRQAQSGPAILARRR